MRRFSSYDLLDKHDFWVAFGNITKVTNNLRTNSESIEDRKQQHQEKERNKPNYKSKPKQTFISLGCSGAEILFELKRNF